MAQLSRPYQIVLLLVAVLALAWFAVLRAHSSPSAGGSSSPSSSGASTVAKAGQAEHNEGKSTPVYHGAAPGLHGLSKDINRAHEAVGISEAQAGKAEGGAGEGTQVAKAAAPATSTSSTQPSSASHRGTADPPAASPSATHGHGSQQSSHANMVGAQLKSGKTVLLLFWNPGSSANQAVHSQVQAAGRSLKGKVALDFAKAREVGSFGTVTREISVLQTPTLLIINRKGLATTITGLTDAFSIEQAVREAGG
jgi:hypothetical protein